MGNPQSPVGHSLQWQGAYLTASPEDGAQRDVVAQLALPIGKSQTREQAERVKALRAEVARMDPRSAERLYQRLTTSRDALGQLFQLTLHHTTRNSLIGELDAKRRGLERGTTDRGVPPPPPPRPPPPAPVHTGDTRPFPWPTWKPVHSVPPPSIVTGPTHIFPPPPGDLTSNILDALKTIVKAGGYAALIGGAFGFGAKAAGEVKGVLRGAHAWRSLSSVDKSDMAREIKKAIGGRTGTDALGAGNERANTWLREMIGRPVLDVDLIRAKFPLIDTIGPDGVQSLAARTGEGRGTFYVNKFQLLLSDRLTKMAAEALSVNAKKIQALGMWPVALPKNASVDTIAGYIRDNATMAILQDDVPLVKGIIGSDAFGDPTAFGIDEKLSTEERIRLVNKLVDRIESSGVTRDILLDAMK